jgi:hypothetical protein
MRQRILQSKIFREAIRPGDFITDEHVLEVPAMLAPGVYTLTAGLYDLKTGERMAVRSVQDSSRETEVRLGQMRFANPD